MEQYKKSGPPLDPASEKNSSSNEVERLRSIVAEQQRQIQSLEKDLRKLRNEVRTAINAANVMASNTNRNG